MSAGAFFFRTSSSAWDSYASTSGRPLPDTKSMNGSSVEFFMTPCGEMTACSFSPICCVTPAGAGITWLAFSR